MAKVSVIVPSYNLGMYLGETLKSVKDQSFTDWECIVVDNGSTDNSVSVAQSFAEADARYLVKKLPLNEGVAAARNRGMALAKGQYLLFLDADDLIAPGYMQAAVEALDADPSLNLVYGKAERGITGQCLHAKKIGFIHPITEAYMEFDSELPEYFTDVLRRVSH